MTSRWSTSGQRDEGLTQCMEGCNLWNQPLWRCWPMSKLAILGSVLRLHYLCPGPVVAEVVWPAYRVGCQRRSMYQL